MAERHDVPSPARTARRADDDQDGARAGVPARARVEGWYSTNILGNRDGQVLNDPASNKTKLESKLTCCDDILGGLPESRTPIVHIHYYRPRGDNKEAWDNIDLVGFLGQRMQIKVNFLCKDSILAAPLVIELVRVLDLAQQRGQGGIQEQLGCSSRRQ